MHFRFRKLIIFGAFVSLIGAIAFAAPAPLYEGLIIKGLNSLSFFSSGSNVLALAHVPTKSALQAIPTSGLAGGSTVAMDGYYAAGDGGGGAYVYSTGSCSLNSGAGDSGYQIQATSGGCWTLFTGGSVSIKSWGAKCDNATDDTTPAQRAVARVGSNVKALALPGKCRVNAQVTLSNTGRIFPTDGDAGFVTTSATADVLVIDSGYRSSIDDLYFGTTVQRTGGSYIRVNSGAWYATIRSPKMDSPFYGVSNFGATGTYFHGGDVNWYAFAPASGSHMMHIDGGYSLVADGFYGLGMSSSQQPDAGLYIQQVGDLIVANSSFILAGHALKTGPTAGQYVASLRATNTFFDTSQVGIDLNAPGGSIVRSDFVQVWASSSSAGSGVILHTSAGGTIDGVNFTNLHSFLNANNGFEIADSGVTNVKLTTPEIAGNVNSGFYAGDNVKHWQIMGGHIGATNGLSGNGTGMTVSASSDYFQVIGVDLTGNTTSDSIFSGVGTATKIFHDNIGTATGAGVTCSGSPTSSFATDAGGRVTHC